MFCTVFPCPETSAPSQEAQESFTLVPHCLLYLPQTKLKPPASPEQPLLLRFRSLSDTVWLLPAPKLGVLPGFLLCWPLVPADHTGARASPPLACARLPPSPRFSAPACPSLPHAALRVQSCPLALRSSFQDDTCFSPSRACGQSIPERLPCARQCTELRSQWKSHRCCAQGAPSAEQTEDPSVPLQAFRETCVGLHVQQDRPPEKGLRAREDARVTPLLTAGPVGSRGGHTAGCGSGGHTPAYPSTILGAAVWQPLVDIPRQKRHRATAVALEDNFRERCKVRRPTSHTLRACTLQL